MKQLFAAFLGFVLCVSDPLPSHAQTLAAELYTIEPGDELFSKFGHAALCGTTPSWSEDEPSSSCRSQPLCFNYGTADFSRPVGLTLDVLPGLENDTQSLHGNAHGAPWIAYLTTL